MIISLRNIVKLISLITLGLPLFMGGLFGIYNGWSYVSHYYFPWKVKKNIRDFEKNLKTFAQQEPQGFLLKDLTNFEWDKVCYKDSYWSDPNVTKKELLHKLNVHTEIYIPDKYEYENALYFINNKDQKVVPIYMNESIEVSQTEEYNKTGLRCFNNHAILDISTHFTDKHPNVMDLMSLRIKEGE